MSDNGPLRLGIVGCGKVVENYHLPVLSTMPEITIAWLCDTDRTRAVALGRVADVTETHVSLEECPDVDAVLLAIPVGLRQGAFKLAFQRRWHTMCEKPFAATFAEHEWIIEEARAAGIQLGVGLMRRHYEGTLAAARAVQTGLVGVPLRIVGGEGGRAHRTGRKDWYLTDSRASGGGALFESGSHLVDQVFAICDAKRFELNSCEQVRWRDVDFETVAHSRVEIANDVRVPLTVKVSMLNDVFNGISIQCERGEIRLGTQPGDRVELLVNGATVGQLGAPGADMPSLYRAIRAQWIEFVHRCRPGFAGTGDTGVLTTAFLDACREMALSADAGNTVTR